MKINMKKSSGKFDTDMGTNIDLSLLRRPLTRQPFTGFHEAKSAFDKGTAEVRHLLLHECSLIYECNVCRNMFRNLANFITHKRAFCCKSALDKNDSHDATNGSMQTYKTSNNVQHKNETELRQNLMPATQSDLVEAEKIQNTSQKNVFRQNEQDESLQQKSTEQVDQSSPSYVFQCPSCSLTFSKSSSVIRHLALAHKIPIRRIRMHMRDSILKRPAAEFPVQNDEKLTKMKTNRETKNSQLIAEDTKTNVLKEKDKNNTKMNDDDEKDDDVDDDDLTKCIFCEKNFKDRNLFSTHLQTCHIKLEMLDKTTTTTTATATSTAPTSTTSNRKRLRLLSNSSSTAAITKEQPSAIDQNEDDDVKRTFDNLEKQDFGIGLQTISLDKLDISAGESTNGSLIIEKEIKNKVNAEILAVLPNSNVVNENDSTTPSSSSSASAVLLNIKKRKQRTNCIMKQSCRCKICGKHFNALSNLRRHISMFHYRSRKYGCALCDYCAFRRYDIINHLAFVHKMNAEDNGETAKLVRVNDVPYTKDDMEEDIVICTNDEKESSPSFAPIVDVKSESEVQTVSPNTPQQQQQSSPPIKRRRRRIKNSNSLDEKSLDKINNDDLSIKTNGNDNNIEVKLTRQMLKRSQSQTSTSNSNEIMHTSTPSHSTFTKGTQKRPTRNRVKPVNKDFVYDMHELLKKGDHQQQHSSITTTTTENETYHLRGSKRRNTLNITNLEASSSSPPIHSFEAIKIKSITEIKGAVRRICLILVNQGLAASSTPPEIPTERPQMRPRLVSIQRNDSQNGPIIDSTELDAARLKSLPLCDDSYLEKIAKESVGSFKMKPCLAQHHSALDSLLQKVDSSLHFLNGGGNARLLNSSNQQQQQQQQPLQHKQEINENNSSTYLDSTYNHQTTTTTTIVEPCYTTPEQAIPKAFIAPTKPQKRLPSLDRLTETINSVENYYNTPSSLER